MVPLSRPSQDLTGMASSDASIKPPQTRSATHRCGRSRSVIWSKRTNGQRRKGSGGGCEIRTHGWVTPSTVFKTVGLNHSPNPPQTRRDCTKFHASTESKGRRAQCAVNSSEPARSRRGCKRVTLQPHPPRKPASNKAYGVISTSLENCRWGNPSVSSNLTASAIEIRKPPTVCHQACHSRLAGIRSDWTVRPAEIAWRSRHRIEQHWERLLGHSSAACGGWKSRRCWAARPLVHRSGVRVTLAPPD